jgi:hypothetical protein
MGEESVLMTKNLSQRRFAEWGGSMLLRRPRKIGTVPNNCWHLAVCALCSALLASLVLTGCGGGTSSVSGKLTLDGEPLARTENVSVTIMFYPESGSGAPAAALADEAGGYVLSTGSQQGLAPGNYVVTLSATEFTPPAVAGGMPGNRVLTPARYANPKQSGLRAEVKPGSNTFNFDLRSDANG